jgi:O-antigen/teichoic acid export membrane protein
MRKSLGSDALKLTISKLITMAIALINAMLLSRFRTLEEYGTYSQLLLVINLATTFFMLGLPNSINYFLAREDTEEGKQKFLSVYYSLSTILSILTGLILVLSAPILIRYFDNPLLKNYVYFLAIFPWTKIIMSSIEHVLIIYNKTKYVMIYKIANSLALLLIIMIVQALKMTFPIYILFYLIVESIFAILVYVLVRNFTQRLSLSLDRKLVGNILKFSIPIGLATMVGRLSIELDKIVIGRFFTTEELAIYTNAARELPVAIISSALTAVLMPHLVRLLKENKNKSAVELWAHSIILSYILISLVAFGVLTYAPEVMTLLYSSKYISGSSVFRIYALVLLLRVTYFGMILNSKGKTKFIFYSSLLSLILNLVLNYSFYKLFGFIGPAIATLLSIAIVQFAQLIATSKIVNITIKSIFPWKELAKITLINVVFSIAFFNLKSIVNLEYVFGNVGESLVMGLIWGTLYIGIMYKKIKISWNYLNSPQ